MSQLSKLNIGCNGAYFPFRKAESENRYVIVNNQARRTITYNQVDPFAMLVHIYINQ